MGRPPKPRSEKRANRMMVYLTDEERDRLQSLSYAMGLDKTELLYEGLHAVLAATESHTLEGATSMKYPDYKDTSSRLDGGKEPCGRTLGDWRAGDPCKVRFFVMDHANQRGTVLSVDGDHCMVQLRAQEQPVRIAQKDLMYWDDDDEIWIMAPTYQDDDDLNSADFPGEHD